MTAPKIFLDNCKVMLYIKYSSSGPLTNTRKKMIKSFFHKGLEEKKELIPNMPKSWREYWNGLIMRKILKI